MFNYIKRTEGGFNPDVSTHVGTNDLSYDKSPEQISLDILKLAKSLKLHNNTIVLSNIIPPDDLYLEKADEVSANLEKL